MWTIRFNGATVQLRDTRGLQYLAALLAQPTRELHATELIGTPGDATARPRTTDDSQSIAADLGDAGAVLDAAATAPDVAPPADLRKDLAEAEGGRSASDAPHDCAKSWNFWPISWPARDGAGGRRRMPSARG